MKILVTGATGFLGGQLVEQLMESADMLYLLVRSKHHKRLQKKYAENPRVKILLGDIANPDVLDDSRDLEEVFSQVETILHAAAYYDLEGNYPSSFMYNVVGTQNVLYMARQCRALKSFHYISTVAVAGDFKGRFTENELDRGQGFSNYYAKTKYEAERMLRQWEMEGVKKRIYRLGVLIGHSQNGAINKVDGPYYFFKAISKLRDRAKYIKHLRFLPVPYDPKALFPIIPVDHAASFIVHSLLNDVIEHSLRCYHVIGHQGPTLSEFLEDTLRTFGLDLKVAAIPRNPFNRFLLKGSRLPEQLEEYLYSACRFDITNCEVDFPQLKKSLYSSYKNVLFEFVSKTY